MGDVMSDNMSYRELLELAAKAYSSEDVIKTMCGFERAV